MAYHDANGKITIDEVAANRDIRKLKEAIEILTSMQKRVTEVEQLASTFSGDYAQAQIEKANLLNMQIRRIINNLNYSVSTITATINKYKALDAKLKQNIMLNGGSSFGSGGGGGGFR